MSEDEAKRRLIRLTAARVLGLLFMLAGLLLIAREPATSVTRYSGVLLTFAGLASLWLLPRALLRRWRRGD